MDHPYRDEKTPKYSADDDIFELMGEDLPTDSPYSDESGSKKIPAQNAQDDFEPKKDDKRPPKQPKSAAPGKKKPPAKRRTIRERLATALLAIVLCAGAGLAVYVGAATANDDLWLDLDQIPYNTSTILYAKNTADEWEEYSVIPCTQNKVWAADESIPDDLRHAFVAVEDKDFYNHSGVNWKRTVFAAFNEVVHAVTGKYPGGVKQGASTIDQQLIKNLTREDEASGMMGYLRKVKEIYRAYKLDAKYDKDTILNAYLNTISFTDNTAGVEAAAQKIFGCSASELSLAECASLAAITRSPARYNPETQPEQHLERRNYVLGEMLEQNYITQEQYDAALAEPLVTTGSADPVKDTVTTDWFTDLVMEDVITDLAGEKGITRAQASRLLYNGGLRIYTTVVPALQTAMSETLRTASVYPQPKATVQKQLTGEDGEPVVDDAGAPVTGAVTVTPQAAMVSLNYQGEICAVAGGLGEKTASRAFDRATMAVRQVGSTMKPIGAYVLGIEENKINWSTSFEDSAVKKIKDEATGEKKDWPRNFSNTYSGKQILVNEALARSINTIAVRVGEKAGVGNIYRFTTGKLGITSFTAKDKAAAPMILGASTYGVSPLQMAAAYAMFGSGGSYTTPHCYKSVQRATGTEVIAPEVKTSQVISADTAYVMNRLLRGVMEGDGTGAGYSVSGGMDCVGKTGTTSDDRDHWFIGLTPYYVTASWYGYDDNLSLSVNYQAHPPTLAWRNVMAQAQKNLPKIDFPVDETVVKLDYCTVTGKLAGANCPRAVGYYRAGSQPTATCTVH